MKNYFTLIVCVLLVTEIMSQKITCEAYTFENQKGEKVEAELCSFEVKENRQQSDSRMITLKFVRFKSTASQPGNPIVYLAGGPGGSGSGTAKGRRFPMFMELRKFGDVIAFDQRGAGFSNSIPDCATKVHIPLDQPGSRESYTRAMADASKTCIEFWKKQGIDLSGYNTAESARDIEDLRKVLGVDQLTLWGISYGSHLAFAAVKLFPYSFDKLVLTGLEGPDHTIKLPANTQGYLRRLAAALEKDKEATAHYGPLIELMDKTHKKLEKKPALVETKHPQTGEMLKVGISKFDLQLVTSFMFTSDPQNAAALPLFYKNIYEGNYQELAMRVAMLRQYSARLSAMPMAMDAMSGISKRRWKIVQKQAREATLGRTTNFPYPDLGEELGLPDLGDVFRENPKSTIPALFFMGTLDGRTYPESTRELVAGFSNGTLITLEGAGHNLFMSSPKVQEKINQFLAGKKLNAERIKLADLKFTLPK